MQHTTICRSYMHIFFNQIYFLYKMFTSKMVVCSLALLLLIALNPRISDAQHEAQKIQDALKITLETTMTFYHMFDTCVRSEMPNMKFSVDDLKGFVNYPSKTTVGFAPKFTNNRKFFANLLTTPEFKNMLAKDEEELRQETIRKMKYCDNVVMDQDLLRDMYDREVDQSKMKKK